MMRSMPRLEIVFRVVRPNSSSVWIRSMGFSSMQENELSLAAAANNDIVEKSKKCNPPGKKSIAERILAVCEKIAERQKPPELRRGGGSRSTDPTRVEIEIMSVAEQRITQSIIRGDFEKLPGKGKPLRLEFNPHADPAEDLAYRILAKNGFAPEWVELNKEIALKIRRWRKALDLAWQRRLKADSGGEAEPENLKWDSLLPKFESELHEINQKVMKYNLLVPFGRQIMCYKLEREMTTLRETEQQSGSPTS